MSETNTDFEARETPAVTQVAETPPKDMGQQHYKDQVTQSNQALTQMAELAIAPTPQNYNIWYEYFAQTNPQLNQRLEQLLKAQQPFSEEICEQLYEEFFHHDDFAISLTSYKAITEIAEQIQFEAEHMGDNISDYGNLLRLSLDELNSNASLAAVQNMATKLISGSEKAKGESDTSSKVLKGMSDEIERLTAELKEASKIANTDPLTGIANRRFFDSAYQEMFAKAQQDSGLICLLIDIDHFKNINDTYGHPVGDLVIRFVANLLSRATPMDGFVARYGGEEFVILLPQKDLQVGEILAEGIRKAICKQELRSVEQNIVLGQITVSVGVSNYQSDDSKEGLIHRTDENLYKAKQTGRNRVIAK